MCNKKLKKSLFLESDDYYDEEEEDNGEMSLAQVSWKQMYLENFTSSNSGYLPRFTKMTSMMTVTTTKSAKKKLKMKILMRRRKKMVLLMTKTHPPHRQLKVRLMSVSFFVKLNYNFPLRRTSSAGCSRKEKKAWRIRCVK